MQLQRTSATPWKVKGRYVGGENGAAEGATYNATYSGTYNAKYGAVIMGILNCTPDSFFDGGQWQSSSQAFTHAREMLEQGAAIIDVGGESSRPGAKPVSEQEELERVLPVISDLQAYRQENGLDFFISIDTVKAEVARQAVKAGADIINDISALRHDPQMAQVVAETFTSAVAPTAAGSSVGTFAANGAETGVGVILNHMQGTPADMQKNPLYRDVVTDVCAELKATAAELVSLGVDPASICLDPGIGFGKTAEDNYKLIAGVSQLAALGYPVLMGMSRKSYIGNTKGLEDSDRLIPSLVSAVLADLGGAAVIRVHDVPETREALTMLKAVRECLTEKD